MPVWSDAFSNDNQKSYWMTFLMLAAPLGVVIGFSVTSTLISNEISWKMSFIGQGVLLIPPIFSILVIPSKYLDIDGTLKAKIKCSHVIQQKLYKRLNLNQITGQVFAPALGAESNVNPRTRGVSSVSNSLVNRQDSCGSKKFDSNLDLYTKNVF